MDAYADGEATTELDVVPVALRDCELRYDRVTVVEAVDDGTEECDADTVDDAGDGDGGTLA